MMLIIIMMQKTQQRINELVKKAEDEQIKRDDPPASHDIHQGIVFMYQLRISFTI